MVALLLALFAPDPEPPSPLKVLARSSYPHARWAAPRGPKGLVIRGAAELVNASPHALRRGGIDTTEQDATRELLAALKAKEVDWKKHMLVVVCAGRKPSAGYRVEITRVRVLKGELKVSWKLRAPRGGADDVLTYPSQCVLLPRHTGKVIFDPPLGK